MNGFWFVKLYNKDCILNKLCRNVRKIIMQHYLKVHFLFNKDIQVRTKLSVRPLGLFGLFTLITIHNRGN